MTRRCLAILVILGFSVLAASFPAHAQPSDAVITTSVPFAFTVGDQSFPAGDYRVEKTEKKYDTAPHRMPALRLRSADGKLDAELTPITRLARRYADRKKGSLVFDREGEKRLLSEVWVPGEDGYLVRGGDEEHQHQVVDVK
jgi:hypothetical protein